MVAQFVRPTGISGAAYSSQAGSSAVWLLTIDRDSRAKIALTDGDSLTVTSNDPAVVPNDFSSTRNRSGQQVFELFGRMGGTAMLEARRNDGTVETYVQVKVAEPDKKNPRRKWIKLAEPQIALNAPNTKRMTMTSSPVIPWDWDAERILAVVGAGTKHVVFNCHGIPTGKKKEFPAPHLAIGTAIHPGNVCAFRKIQQLGSVNVIWLSACNLADGSGGTEFCRNIAMTSGCYVVSYFLEVPDLGNHRGDVPDCYPSQPVYFGRNGATLFRGNFFALNRKLGFELRDP